MPTSADERLARHREVWESKPLLRELYGEWFEMIASHLGPGSTVEIGSGPSRFAEFQKEVITTDIVSVPWIDLVMDAARIPLKDNSVGNLVMLDVFHHIENPGNFLDEAERVLSPGGRVIMVEPYVSPFSYLVYNFIHEEAVNMKEDPFTPAEPSGQSLPFDGNGALPTLTFWRRADRFKERWPGLEISRKELFSFILYPLSGGYGFPGLIPRGCVPLVRLIEKSLRPFSRLLSFRTLVVLNKL